MAGSVFAYCACRDPGTGKRYPRGKCPRFESRGHKRWGYAIDLEPVGGRRQMLHRSGFETRLAAERALEKQVPAIREGTAPTLADRSITLGAYLDTWLASDPTWRPSTVATYRTAVNRYIRPALGHIRLAALRPDHIRAMLAEIRERELSRRTVHTAYAVLRTALRQAIREQRISWNPCSAVKVEGPGRTVPEVWTPEQVAMFLAHAEQAEPRLAIAYRLAAWRGLRRGELAGLKWADLDLDTGTARIERNVTEVDRQLCVGEPKTERGKRTVSLGPKLTTALRAHRKAQAAERLAAPYWRDEGWVFTDERGGCLPPHVLTHRFKALAKELPELPELHLHRLRHTAATHMLLAGVAPKTVQDQLGHATLAMTMDTYGHVLKPQRDASADAVEALYGSL